MFVRFADKFTADGPFLVREFLFHGAELECALYPEILVASQMEELAKDFEPGFWTGVQAEDDGSVLFTLVDRRARPKPQYLGLERAQDAPRTFIARSYTQRRPAGGWGGRGS